MLLHPISDDCALAIVHIETNAETRTDCATHHGRYVDGNAVGKGKGDVDRLTDRESCERLHLHAADGKVAAFGGHAIAAIVTAYCYRYFKGNARRAAGFTAELELSFGRCPLLGSRGAAKNR